MVFGLFWLQVSILAQWGRSRCFLGKGISRLGSRLLVPGNHLDWSYTLGPRPDIGCFFLASLPNRRGGRFPQSMTVILEGAGGPGERLHHVRKPLLGAKQPLGCEESRWSWTLCPAANRKFRVLLKRRHELLGERRRAQTSWKGFPGQQAASCIRMIELANRPTSHSLFC